ncbi:MAG: ZIP family metal transporter [Nanoarchaeota archaeon]
MVLTSVYVFVSVIVVSLVSLLGIVSILLSEKKLDKLLLTLVSLSAGTLLGGAFLHILPEAVEKQGFTILVSLSVLGGVLIFFILDKFIRLHHCDVYPSYVPTFHLHHGPHQHRIGILNLAGDALHNLLDGLVIAGAYLVNVPAGIATTIAVVLHEVPQELADFGVLLYAGYSKKKALMLNLLSALAAVLGAVVGLVLGMQSEVFLKFVLPFAAGGFIYIAGSSLIPELHKECGWKESILQIIAFITGIGLMWALLLLD